MIGGAAFAVVGLLLLLTAIRIFTATLYQSLFGLLPNTTLGAVAIGVFAASLLAVVTAWRLGPRRGIAWSGLVLAAATVLVAVIRYEWAALALSAIAIVAGTHWLALLHASRTATRGSPLPLGLPIALAADLGLRAIFGTLPLTAAPTVLAGPVALVAGLLFLAAGIASLPADVAWAEPGPRGALGLLAVGPLLLVTETGALNGAQIAAAGGLGLDGDRSTQIGLLLAAGGAALGLFARSRPWPARPIAAAAVAAGAAALWAAVPILSLVGGALLAAGALAAATLLTSGPLSAARSPWRTVVALGLGWVLFVGGAFAFYAFYAFAQPVWALTALVALAVLAVPPWATGRLATGLAVTGGILVVALPAAALALGPAAALAGPSSPVALRVMTYNVHQGFDAGNVPSLDRIAETILREDPDVVVLQEVVRGWLIDEQHDVLGYLASRLRMGYVFDPHIGDLYGNAILSRYPITEVRRIQYVKEPGVRYQPRGAVIARIGGDGALLRPLIAATHLDEHDDASAVRAVQVRELLDAIGKAVPALILCDCNALPDAAELGLVADAGFADLAARSGGDAPTFPADAPVKRIDYVFGAGVVAEASHVVASTASDHRPLVVTVTFAR